MVSLSKSITEEVSNGSDKYCFYLDVPQRELSKTLSSRIQDLGLREESHLSELVTHVVRGSVCVPAARSARTSRADAMLERVLAPSIHSQTVPLSNLHYKTITVPEAILLLDQIYSNRFRAPKQAYFKAFKKHYIKVEILDRICRPLYKEFDEWPELALEPLVPKQPKNNIFLNRTLNKMTRKSRPRIKQHEEKAPKGGYCEICNTDYTDVNEHQRSLHHLTFVRNDKNFLSLDKLIGAGADVESFLEKATPLNGERRSQRKICNGEIDNFHNKSRHSNRSQSPDSTINVSPKRMNGVLDEDIKHNTRNTKHSSDRHTSEDRQYYKVVGVSTKLRSSGGFSNKSKDSPTPTCNGGSKPLVVKFRKVRRSELSVLSDEAEQFMFPKRASSTSSTCSSDGEEKVQQPVRRSPPVTLERRRLARPMALKEESSEDDSWPENKRKRKRKPHTVVRRTRLHKDLPCEETPEVVTPVEVPTRMEVSTAVEVETPMEVEIAVENPLIVDSNPIKVNTEPIEKCMKWEDGKLKYTPAVEQLEFAFESVPQCEPWFETFKRQDEDKVVTKNVPKYFALYTKSPKLPYEIGPLPPLKPNCCPLSDLVKREEKPGPSRSYGTRGNKKQRIRKRTVAALLALEAHPRKSPREHASTLAILGSAGLLHRRKHAEDSKSTASEDTISETQSNTKLEPDVSDTQEVSERLQKFFSEVFDDAAEYEIPEETMEGEVGVTTSNNAPDVLNLVSECEGCEIIRDEIASSRSMRRGHKFKKKNRTGWPNKKKAVKKCVSRSISTEEVKDENSMDRSSMEPADNDEFTHDESMSEVDEPTVSSTCTVLEYRRSIEKSVTESDSQKSETEELDKKDDKSSISSDDRPLRLDVKLLLQSDKKNDEKPKIEVEKDEEKTNSSTSDAEDKTKGNRKTRNCIQNVSNWLQPIVRVARVDPSAARRLRSAARPRSSRYR